MTSLGYRKKVNLHARYTEGWKFGLMRRMGREELLIPIPRCPIHSDFVSRIVQSANLDPVLPLYYLCIVGKVVTLVLKMKEQENIVLALREREAEWRRLGTEALFINWNPAVGRRVLSSKHWSKVFGEDWIKDGGYFHGPSSFRQQIPELEHEALGRAQTYLLEANVERFVDLYCGIGVGLQAWTSSWKNVLGIELHGESVKAAYLNAPDATVLVGRVEDRIPQLRDYVNDQSFVLYCNPPRSGLGGDVIEWIMTALPNRIAYLSCSMKSLKEDLRRLESAYAVDEVQPFDFFPLTDHVEVLVLMRRRNS